MLQALHVAAADPKPYIVDRALDCSQAVVSSLFKGIGIDGDSLGNVIAILEAAMKNQGDASLSSKACGILPSVTEKMISHGEKVWLSEAEPFDAPFL